MGYGTRNLLALSKNTHVAEKAAEFLHRRTCMEMQIQHIRLHISYTKTRGWGGVYFSSSPSFPSPLLLPFSSPRIITLPFRCSLFVFLLNFASSQSLLYLYVKISTGVYISPSKSHLTTGYIPKIFIHPRSSRT
jgi:hypothetical protein